MNIVKVTIRVSASYFDLTALIYCLLLEIDDESIISEDDNTRQDESFVQMDESTNVQKAEALKKQLGKFSTFCFIS